MKFWGKLLSLPAVACMLAACNSNGGYSVAVAKNPAPRTVVVHDHIEHGPPPHAPAHGYRHKHQHHNVDLVYDAGLGVYYVEGYDDYYFADSVYFRYVSGHWEMSASIGRDARWQVVASHSVPPKLSRNYGAYKHHGKGKDKGKKRGNRGRGKGR